MRKRSDFLNCLNFDESIISTDAGSKTHGMLANDETANRLLEFTAMNLFDLDVYRHDNGFIKVLIGEFSGLQIRVHVWDESSNATMSNIHSHRHPIISRIIAGSISEQRWIADKSGTEFDLYHFMPNISGMPELSREGGTRLRSHGSFERTAGDVYEVPLGDFHSVETDGSLAVSLFTQNLSVRGDGKVAAPAGSLIHRSRPEQLGWADRRRIARSLGRVSL